MVRLRAAVLGVIDGRSAHEPSKSDQACAKRELTGDPDMDAYATALEAMPETEAWNPVPASAGQRIEVAPSEDEDEEGRSDRQRLVEEGMAGAEHDRMRQAAREATIDTRWLV
jgi:hypothetical protein